MARTRLRLNNTVHAFIYEKILDAFTQVFQTSLLGGEQVKRRSLAFRLYIEILKGYISTLDTIERRPDLIRPLQERRLRKILKTANKTQWWQSYFQEKRVSPQSIQSLDDLQKISPVTRLDLADVPRERLMAHPTAHNRLVWRHTSGSTTGTPFAWGLNKTSLYLNICARLLREFAYEGFPLEQSWGTDFLFQFITKGKDVSVFRWFFAGDFSLGNAEEDLEQSIRDIAEQMERTGLCAVFTTANQLRLFLHGCTEYKVYPPVFLFLVTGEFLEEGLRTAVAEYFKSIILVNYGTRETGPLAIECKKNHRFYHIFSERSVIEITDQSGINVESGTPGHVLVTLLDNTAMPLIRYDIGDIGILHHTMQCDCQNHSPLLEIQNREGDHIIFGDGHTESINRVLKTLGSRPFTSHVRRFQVRQEALDQIHIVLEIKAMLPDMVIARLKEAIARKYDHQFKEIEVTQVPLLYQTGAKFKVFIPLRSPVTATS